MKQVNQDNSMEEQMDLLQDTMEENPDKRKAKPSIPGYKRQAMPLNRNAHKIESPAPSVQGDYASKPQPENKEENIIKEDTMQKAKTEGNTQGDFSPPPPPPKKKRRGLKIALISILVVIAILVGTVLFIVQWASSELFESDDVWSGSVIEEIQTEALPEYTGKGIVAGLVCGIAYDNEDADGYTTDEKVGNTDMIMYVMFDTVNNTINILQIPRDTYIGEDIESGPYQKINGVYVSAEDPAKRMEALATTIYEQLKLPVDFYVKLDLDSMKALVDHMGRLDVFLTQDVVDPENPENVLSAGWQSLTGTDVEFVVRNRNYPNSDITRMQMQMSIYSALFREFKELTPTDLMMWMRILLYYVDVGGFDDDIMQVAALAIDLLEVESSDVAIIRPAYGGSQDPRGDGQDYIYLLPQETADVLNEYFRPDGHVVPAEELDIHTFPTAEYGTAPSSITTIGDMQSVEGEAPPDPTPPSEVQ